MSDKTSVQRGPKDLRVKTRTATYAMTTATMIATLPKGSRAIGAFLQGAAAGTATAATLSFGTSTSADEYASANVLAAGVGDGGYIPFDATANAVLTAATPIYVKYAETGGTSSTGTWVAHILYTDGNFLNDVL